MGEYGDETRASGLVQPYEDINDFMAVSRFVENVDEGVLLLFINTTEVLFEN
ncbi:hypothetical protein AGMMS49556_09620 [Endomicrobiia bacterium]|nr:hypothetical protein AGMMS49556_09620 [Endomicrobiia bacterium]